MPRGIPKNKKVEAAPVVAPEIKQEKPKPAGHPVYVPTPDMGDIKPPAKELAVCSCGHRNETHYGGARGHCNSPGCTCLEFK